MSQSNEGRFSYLEPDDVVIRLLGGEIPLEMRVVKIEDGLVYANDVAAPLDDDEELWKFDVNTGAEIDELLCWDNNKTGSVLVAGHDKSDVPCYDIHEVQRSKLLGLLLSDD